MKDACYSIHSRAVGIILSGTGTDGAHGIHTIKAEGCIIEELETSNEELQSTYEEAQSTNEELYTSTEELQTSNEELQSTNEEVAIKNDEIEATNAKVLMMNAVLEKEIDERKQAEQSLKEQKDKLRTIIDSEPAWVNVCNNEGVIMEVNPAGLETMEADSTDQLVGKKLIDLVAAEDKNELLSCQEELEQGQTRKHSVEVTSLKGSMRWLEISTVRLPDELGENLQMMSIICDQTQFKEAQNKLVKRQAELSQLMRINTLGAMATGLAHELNQPLAAIGNYLSGCENLIAQEGCDRDEIRHVLKLANQQLQRTGDIVRQIKGFVEQDREHEILNEAVNINECIDNAIKMLRNTGFFKKLEVNIEADQSLPPVFANHVQIEQVIINLIMNAIESMEALEPQKRSLEIHSLLKDGSHVEVQIKDRGQGMSEEERQEVFKPFHTTKEKGMGMGLCISHTIIELHTGQMTITDRKGGGTIFSFMLPVYKENT